MKKRIMSRSLTALAVGAALLATTDPVGARAASGTGAVVADSARPAGAVTDHVILVSIDGLRPDALDEFHMETLQRLLREGSGSLQASTILPSKTLPSHTSMLTGRVPEAHGVLHNRDSDAHGVVAVPTIFELARDHGFRTAAFYSKAKFRHLDRPDAYDYRQAPGWNSDTWMATRTVPQALQYLRHERPNLLFIHIGETDYAGHATGWMSFFYGLAAKRADAAVERIVEEAERTFGAGRFTILVTSDHGGHGRDHGSDDPLDTTIPWIAYGQGVRPGLAPDGIRTMDTGATVLWLLGVPVPPEAEGQPITGAFAAPRAVAGVPAS